MPIAASSATPANSLLSVPLRMARSGTAVISDMARTFGKLGNQRSGVRGLLRPVTLGALALQLAGAADRGGPLARALLGRLLVMPAQLHLAIHALALQLLLERAQRLVDIVVANDDL